ncbi:Wzz/FepE/Etk N-terminal domain-containing protein [bacterium]|nr:Wzz/FepE/Etk N-terminal domain-containing protein [bacterium]
MEKSNSGIVRYFAVLVTWRRLLIINFFIFTISMAIFSLIMPKTFTATTTILPPSASSDGFGLASLVGNTSFGGLLDLGGIVGETNIFLAILRSRTVMETIAQQFDLTKVYETENVEETLRVLSERYSTEINEDGTISIMASAQTGFAAYSEEGKNVARFLARDLANAFADELDRVNKRLKTEKARNNRKFVETRYFQNLEDLSKAEDELKAFQETREIIALPEQMQAAIETAAELHARVISKEVEAEVLRGYVSSSHHELTRTETELKELRKKLTELKYGRDGRNGKNQANGADIFIPLDKTPQIGLQYVRLLREVTLQQKIQEFLLPQYEQAKIQEAKDTPTVQILDPAIAPIRRSSPQRTLMVIFSGFLSLIMSVCLILIFEYVNRIREEGDAEYIALREAFEKIRQDIPFLRK